ncbi:MAG: YraN family protein [Crocinitomicaceae bacterium]|nr:YraN family protein [Crocinitomicaceae bacterium]
MAYHIELGKAGERMAAEYLVKKGYEILHRNYSFKKSELDIVAKKDDVLIVVEVKTRNSDFMAGPEITVTKKKQKAIVKATNYYLEEHHLQTETQFDIISIILNSKEQTLEHIEDAFYPLL